MAPGRLVDQRRDLTAIPPPECLKVGRQFDQVTPDEAKRRVYVGADRADLGQKPAVASKLEAKAYLAASFMGSFAGGGEIMP